MATPQVGKSGALPRDLREWLLHDRDRSETSVTQAGLGIDLFLHLEFLQGDEARSILSTPPFKTGSPGSLDSCQSHYVAGDYLELLIPLPLAL